MSGPSGVTCASTKLCIAFPSSNGEILISTDPLGGSAAWVPTTVPNISISSVACPEVALCAAVGGSSAAVSRDPGATGSQWRVTPNLDHTVVYDCGKYGPQDCSSSLDTISCPSTSFCAAMDDQGGVLTGDPSSNDWGSTSGEGNGGEIDGFACSSRSVCLTECAVGSGTGADCPGHVYDAGVICGTENCTTVSPTQLSGIWCPSDSLCYAGSEPGALYVSRDPGGGYWSRVYPSSPTGVPFNGLACPSSSSCYAVGDNGDLYAGSPPPDAQQLRLVLRRLLSSSRCLHAFIARSGCTLSFSPAFNGRISLRWYAPTHRRASHSGNGTLIASAEARLTAWHAHKLRVRLSRGAARRLTPGLQLRSTGLLAPGYTAPIRLSQRVLAPT